MFHTGKDFIVSLQVVSLIATHIRFSHQRTQVRIFPASFRNTPPTGIPANVNHRAECPVDAIRTGFNGGDTCHTFDSQRVPTTGKCQWNRENGFIAVNNICPYQQRNPQTGRIDSYTLQINNLSYSFHIKKTTDFLITNQSFQLFTIYIACNQITTRRKIQLSQLFVQCHLSHQICNILIHFLITLFKRR